MRIADDSLIGTVLGGYRVVERIGSGGMGSVYRAVLESIGAQVAIKVLARELVGDDDMAARFVAEAKLANLVRHDGLVNVIGFGFVPDGRPYLVMELLTGEPLSAVLRRVGKLPIGTLCELACEALAALAALHERGIVHRDVKPANLIVTASGRIKLIDFGIAKLVTRPGLTATGETLGTREYMAPEQLAGETIDARTDLYALGTVMFEAATARAPFPGGGSEYRLPPSAGELAPEIPDELDAAIRKAMHPEPRLRFASAVAMETVLRDVIAKLPAEAFAPLPRARPQAPALPGRAATRSVAEERSSAPIGVDTAVTAAQGHRIGRYAIEGTLGRGAGGIVLVGRDPVVGRRVAIKRLHDAAGIRRDRLIEEARAMAQIAHPNVVTLYELGNHCGELFLAMELVDGSDLATWLQDRRGWREIVRVFVAAGRGLAAAHAAGVVHRDFKPANVLLGRDGRPRVGDFGLAAATVGGTPAYMAPEQFVGDDVDARADQFAFCASLWESLHGERAFGGDSLASMATEVVAGRVRPPANRDVPAALTAVLRRGLATADARFSSMDALLSALERAVAPQRWPWVVAGAVAVCAAAAIAIVRSSSEPAHPPALPPAITLAEIQRSTNPGEVLRLLASLPRTELASPEARLVAADAAAAGPMRVIETGAHITAATFSLDGARIAVASGNRVALYPIAGGPPWIVAMRETPRSLRFVGDTLYAIVGGGVVEVGGGDVMRCPAIGENIGAPLVGHHAVPGINASPDIRFVACPTMTGTAIFDGQRKLRDAAGSVEFPTNHNAIVTARDGVTLLELPSGRAIARLPAGTLVAATEHVLAVAADRTIRIATPTRTLTISPGFEVDQMLMPTEGEVIASSARGDAGMWRVTGETIRRWHTDGLVHQLALSPGDPAGRVVTRTSSGLEMRDFRSGRRLDTAITTERDAAWETVSPSGGVVALVKESQLALWFTDLRAPRAFAMQAKPTLVALAADGRTIAYGTETEIIARDLVSGAQHVAPVKATLLRITDDGSVAAVTADRRVVVWRPGAAPRDLGAIAGKPVAVFALPGDRAAVSLDDRTLRVVTAGGTSAVCGDRPAVRLRGTLAVVRDRDRVATCDLETGAIHVLPGAGPLVVAAGLVATPAGVFRDGAAEPFPPIADPSALDLDTRGGVLAAATPHGLSGAVRGARVAIALPGSVGATLPTAGSTRIASVIGDRIVAWELGHPGAPHLLGLLANRVVLDLVVPERDEVITIGATGTAYVADAWPAGAPSLAEIDGWLRLVR